MAPQPPPPFPLSVHPKQEMPFNFLRRGASQGAATRSKPAEEKAHSGVAVQRGRSAPVQAAATPMPRKENGGMVLFASDLPAAPGPSKSDRTPRKANISLGSRKHSPEETGQAHGSAKEHGLDSKQHLRQELHWGGLVAGWAGLGRLRAGLYWVGSAANILCVRAVKGAVKGQPEVPNGQRPQGQPTTRPSAESPAHYGDWFSRATKKVALIGDSSLDNILWVEAGQSISKQLHAVDVAVCNLAADGFTTADVLHGSRSVISSSARRFQEPIRWSSGNIFRPLEQLGALQPQPTHVVLSVGGNDVRHILGSLSQPERLQRTLQTLMENYVGIANKIRQICPRATLILMLQYRPCCDPDEDRHYRVYAAMETVTMLPGGPQFSRRTTSLQKLNALMESIYRRLLPQLMHLQPKIIDMPNSFNVHSKAHYSHQIEPSAEGGQIIADLIHAAMKETNPAANFFHYAPGQWPPVQEGEVVDPSKWKVWVDDAAPLMRSCVLS